MGKIIHIFPFLPVRISVKVISFFFSLGTLLFAYRLFKRISGKGYISILALGIFSHLLGYIYLSGSVSYDIFTNFFAMGSIFCLIRFIQERNVFFFLLCISFLSLGSISKITFLPLTAIGGLFLFGYTRKTIFQKKFWIPLFQKTRGYVLLVSSILFFSLALHLYGTNIIQYQRIIPTCGQVLPNEICEKNHFTQRDRSFEKNQENIRQSYAYTPISYTFEWLSLMHQKITGIEVYQKICQKKEHSVCSLHSENSFWWKAHIYPPQWFRYITDFIVVFSLFSSLFFGLATLFKVSLPSWISKKIPWKLLGTLFGITIFYMGSIFLVNYHAYLFSGETNMALHGRYLFPILPLFCFLIVYYLLIPFPQKIQKYTSFSLFILFCWNALPTFILHHESKYILTFHETLLPKGPCSIQEPYCGELNPEEWEYCPSEHTWKCIEE